jgi:indole-3-glycerol phosphate synthase
MGILERIVEYKRREELPRRMGAAPLEEVRARAERQPPALDLAGALRAAPGVALIAEVKRASPSKGVLCHDFDPVRLAAAYAANGAAAVSVLTDEAFFQGSLDHLRAIRAWREARMPLLRKDFIVHPYQVYEARAAGADALLLIAAALGDGELAELLALTRGLGMTALVEVHDEKELRRVLPLEPRLVGANNRDLHTFRVDLEVCLSLRSLVPAGVCFVAESGIHTRADVERLAAGGVAGVLVGEALVTAPDVGAKVRELANGQRG